MGIILTFAGLFSAVNSTFIIGTQPNPGETTNILLLHLIQMTANGTSAVNDISNLSSSTGYPPSTIWTQTLAYASLSFSVLAAFGAVMGKQWLNSYKAARGRGSLEARCMQRQRKLDGLEYFHLQTVLQVFLILLQISLLLFGLSLSANMWMQQTTISSVIISTTALGILIYASTIVVSMLRPDSPFQTPGAELLGAICKKFLAICVHFLPYRLGRLGRTLTPDGTSIKLSAIRWILETSTHPEVVEAAAAMVPLVQWPRDLDASAIYARLRDNFEACRDREEVFVKCGKAMAHLCSQSLKIRLRLRWRDVYTRDCWGGKSRFIRDAFVDSHNACKQLMNTQKEVDEQKHRADARTALRTMVVHGYCRWSSLPDDERLIWNGDLRWCHSNGLAPKYEEFDWLIDYLADEAGNKGDDETEGDALLALSAMRGLGSSTKRRPYITALIRCMGSTRPPRVRHAALRAVSDAREELASITHESMPPGVDATLLDKLSCAILTAVHPNHDQTVHNSLSDASFHYSRDCCYTHLIFVLATNDEWHERLARDGHLERCTSLVEKALELKNWIHEFYLAGIFARVDPSDKVLSLSPAQERLWTLVRTIWGEEMKFIWPGPIMVVPDVVTVTRQYLRSWGNNVPNGGLADLARDVRKALESLQSGQEFLLTVYLIAQADFDDALSSIQGLDNDLRRMIENSSTSQRDDGFLGS
ncbi:hypothetical protein DEU56DRAFT_819394 [Suillus clintonianus]|uniref:uncharacterized protein n=1 Tax=Suillus clintonianus TaxID=1904413 RepID=UPI001B86519F|nr:uncharacterized protein DEU56DRAFT_819394 [Suillus clintonianus]KAG2128253.1 hypothetical protein DEU56DRAFT_819394 [Suillus clintonianus]